MLSVLAADTHCVTALAVIMQFILNDCMPPAVRTLLTTASLVSLVKDEHDGRRPVAVGEMLYRLAARYALFRVLDPAQKALRPAGHQLLSHGLPAARQGREEDGRRSGSSAPDGSVGAKGMDVEDGAAYES
jgi:hypothetical protein